MAKTNTRPIKVGKYNVTSHAQNRIVEPNRYLKKTDAVDYLYLKPLTTGPIKYDKKGRPSYSRIGRYAITQINSKNNNLTSIWRTSKIDAKKYHLERRGRKYVKKVSENLINLLKHFNYSEVDQKKLENFINIDVPCEISGLVGDDEEKHIQIDRKFLNNLEDAIDELNDYLTEEIDLDDINQRLKESKNV